MFKHCFFCVFFVFFCVFLLFASLPVLVSGCKCFFGTWALSRVSREREAPPLMATQPRKGSEKFAAVKPRSGLWDPKSHIHSHVFRRILAMLPSPPQEDPAQARRQPNYTTAWGFLYGRVPKTVSQGCTGRTRKMRRKNNNSLV